MEFDKVRDKTELVWDFSVKASEKMKQQIFQLLIHILENVKDPKDRRVRFLLPMQWMYQYCIKPHILNLLYIFLKSEIPYPRNKDNHLKQSFFHPLFSAFCATLVSIINDFLLNANSAAVFLPRHLYLAVLFCDLY